MLLLHLVGSRVLGMLVGYERSFHGRALADEKAEARLDAAFISAQGLQHHRELLAQHRGASITLLAPLASRRIVPLAGRPSSMAMSIWRAKLPERLS